MPPGTAAAKGDGAYRQPCRLCNRQGRRTDGRCRQKPPALGRRPTGCQLREVAGGCRSITEMMRDEAPRCQCECTRDRHSDHRAGHPGGMRPDPTPANCDDRRSHRNQGPQRKPMKPAERSFIELAYPKRRDHNAHHCAKPSPSENPVSEVPLGKRQIGASQTQREHGGCQMQPNDHCRELHHSV